MNTNYLPRIVSTLFKTRAHSLLPQDCLSPPPGSSFPATSVFTSDWLLSNRTFLVRLGGVSGLYGLAMGIWDRLRLVKVRAMVRPNSPDMTPNRTKKRYGALSIQPKNPGTFETGIIGTEISLESLRKTRKLSNFRNQMEQKLRLEIFGNLGKARGVVLSSGNCGKCC